MVIRRLAKEGKTVTLSQPPREEDVTYNPTTGDVTGGTTSTCSVKALILDFALVSNGLQSKAGTVISIDDKECYLSPVDTNGTAFPKQLRPNDKLTIDGHNWTIVTIKEYDLTGSNPIMYKLLIKR